MCPLFGGSNIIMLLMILLTMLLNWQLSISILPVLPLSLTLTGINIVAVTRARAFPCHERQKGSYHRHQTDHSETKEPQKETEMNQKNNSNSYYSALYTGCGYKS